MTKTLVLLFALLTTATGPLGAQVSARQGVAPPPEIVHFASPMILEIPLPDVRALGPRAHIDLPNVRRYVCDNHVSLLSLTVSKQYKGPRRARSLELVVAGLVSVVDSYDRRADLAVRLKSGDEILASWTLRNLKAEEERNTPFRILLPVAEASLVAAFAGDAPPNLEFSLTVRDDS